MNWTRGVAAIGWLLAGMAAAQTNTSLSNADAVQLYREGMTAYQSGQFEQAVSRFKAADQLRPSASLSYDIAECYEKLADLRNARSYFEQYLRRAPNAADHSKVEAELASIDAQLIEASKVAPPPAPLVVTEEAPARPPNRVASYVLMGLGAVGLGVAIGLNAAAGSSASSLVNAPAPQPGPSAQGAYDSANSLWIGSLVGYIAGGVVLATGATIFLAQTLSRPGPTTENDMGVEQ